MNETRFEIRFQISPHGRRLLFHGGTATMAGLEVATERLMSQVAETEATGFLVFTQVKTSKPKMPAISVAVPAP